MPGQQPQGVPHNISPYATPHAYDYATLGQSMQQMQPCMIPVPVPGAKTWQQQHTQLPPQQSPYLPSRQGVTQAQPQLLGAYAQRAFDASDPPVQPPSRSLTDEVVRKNSGAYPMKDQKTASTSKKGPFPLFPLENVGEELARGAYLAMVAILTRESSVPAFPPCGGGFHEEGLHISYVMKEVLVPNGCWVFFGRPALLDDIHQWLKSLLQEARKARLTSVRYTGLKALPASLELSPVSRAVSKSLRNGLLEVQAKGTRSSLEMAKTAFEDANRRRVLCGCYQLVVVKDADVVFTCHQGDAKPVWPGENILELRRKRKKK